jgi:hypothetical protein
LGSDAKIRNELIREVLGKKVEEHKKELEKGQVFQQYKTHFCKYREARIRVEVCPGALISECWRRQKNIQRKEIIGTVTIWRKRKVREWSLRRNKRIACIIFITEVVKGYSNLHSENTATKTCF